MANQEKTGVRLDGRDGRTSAMSMLLQASFAPAVKI
jgi:hypothetical protein